jgi:hypothetical protein
MFIRFFIEFEKRGFALIWNHLKISFLFLKECAQVLSYLWTFEMVAKSSKNGQK